MSTLLRNLYLILRISFSGEDKIYQNRLESQRNLARQLKELEKTLQFSRKDSEAYAILQDAYDEEVEVSLSKHLGDIFKVFFCMLCTIRV